MAGINNNLFPPIVDSFTPAFVIKTNSSGTSTGVCNVYFSLSLYNNYNQIKHVQVIVQDQNNNKSVLNSDKYPSGIKITDLKVNEEREVDKYYIQISSDDLQKGFELNTYYKVQIRFSSIAYDGSPLDTWFSQNLRFFSEWSTVTLIRPISRPSISMKNFDAEELASFYFSQMDLRIIGSISFDDSSDQELLKSYKIYIYDKNGNLIFESQTFYPNPYTEKNQISYQLLQELNTGEEYKLGIQITTKNSYIKEFKYTFSIQEDDTEQSHTTIDAIPDNIGGRILIKIEKDPEQTITNDVSIIIKRTSNKSQFKVWEDFYAFSPINFKENCFEFYDYTAEAGTFYKYAVLKETVLGLRKKLTELQNPVMLDIQDIFLNTATQQLKVRFDPQMSSFAYNISESKTDTIGSRYPFFRRNGNIKYRSFPLGGTITIFMDIRQNLMKASKQDVFRKTGAQEYEKFRTEKAITDFTDIYYEREFRKKVMDFLYENNVKLFRSPTEGNILVKLMDISFSPNATLGRKIYSFSCTAYEVDECTIKNMIKYNVLDAGDNSKITQSDTNQNNQVFPDYEHHQGEENYPPAIEDFVNENNEVNLMQVLSSLETSQQHNYTARISELKGVQLALKSKPYLIREGVNGEDPVVVVNSNDTEPGVVLGYLIKINGTPIIINKDGIYQTSSDVSITSLILQEQDYEGIELTYDAVRVEEIDYSTIEKSSAEFDKVGQLEGLFKTGQSLMYKLTEKYNKIYYPYSSNKEILTLEGLTKLGIYAKAGTVIKIQQTKNGGYDKFIINETEYIEFDNVHIYDFYFDNITVGSSVVTTIIPALIDYKVHVIRKRY